VEGNRVGTRVPVGFHDGGTQRALAERGLADVIAVTDVIVVTRRVDRERQGHGDGSQRHGRDGGGAGCTIGAWEEPLPEVGGDRLDVRDVHAAIAVDVRIPLAGAARIPSFAARDPGEVYLGGVSRGDRA